MSERKSRMSEKFIQVPMSVLARKDLSSTAKLLYGLVLALSEETGCCWETNAYLGECLGSEPTYMSALAGILERGGLIRREFDMDKGSVERRLYPLPPTPAGRE